MSFVNSILSSLNDGSSQDAKPTGSAAQRPNQAALVRKDNQGPASNGARPPIANGNGPPKRKAEDSGSDVKAKVARIERNGALAAPPARSTTSSPAQKSGIAPPPKTQVPYRGTGRPAGQPSATAAASKPATPAAPATAATSSKPPAAAPAPKTGYLAILEKAKAAQAAAQPIGQIKHKPVEKVSRKERLQKEAEAQAAAKNKAPAAKGGRQTPKSRSRSAEPVEPKAAAGAKDKKKPVEVGYKGTMRPAPSKEPSYQGTMRAPGTAPRKPLSSGRAQPGRYGGSSRNDRYATWSEEEEEDEMEEEDDYGSESDDMEAGMDDVWNEEEESARIAKKEDLEALRQENELKRQKLERKRKLQQLSAAAKAKKRF